MPVCFDSSPSLPSSLSSSLSSSSSQFAIAPLASSEASTSSSFESDQESLNLILDFSINDNCNLLPECWMKVFENLNLFEKLRFRNVSKTWKPLIEKVCLNDHDLLLFDNHTMMRNYIFRRFHLYNLDNVCTKFDHYNRHYLIPKGNECYDEGRFLINIFPNITNLIVGSPWFFDRETMINKWNLESLALYTEKQSTENLQRLFLQVLKLEKLVKFALFNSGSCIYNPQWFCDIFPKLERFCLFDYKYDNITDLLNLFKDNIKSLSFDNVKILDLPKMTSLKDFTYGWSDNKTQNCQLYSPNILEQISYKFPNLESFTFATKYDLDVLDRVQKSGIDRIATLFTLKLYILLNDKIQNSLKSIVLIPMKNIKILHLFFMPVIDTGEDFCSTIRFVFPSLKSLIIHSHQGPMSRTESSYIQSQFKDIEFQFYNHQLA